MPNVPISGFTVPANTVGIGLTGYSLTGSSALSMIDLAGTWNTSGTPTAFKLNITETGLGSNASSLLMDLQVGGASQLSVRKDGRVFLAGNASAGFAKQVASNYVEAVTGFSASLGASNGCAIQSGGVTIGPTGTFSFTNSNGQGSSDTILRRRAVSNFQLGPADAGAIAATVSITIASPAVVSWGSHTLSTGTPVVFTTTGALPTGITAGTTYYVIFVDISTFQIATSFANALAGTAINTSGSQSGTHTGTRNAIVQRLSAQGVTGVLDRPGADFVIAGSQGTGTGAGGSIIFQVAPAGSSGTAQNALATALTIASDLVTTISNCTIPNGGQFRLGTGGVTISGTANLNASFSTVGGAIFDFGNFGSSVLGIAIRQNNVLGWFDGSGTSFTNLDVRLARDAANTLALRNGTNAQTFRVYNTFTDASNYERGIFQYSSNVLQIGHEAAGTGTALRTVSFRTGGVEYFNIGAASNFITVAANRILRLSGGSGSLEIDEGSGVTAPAANRVRIYAEDDGAGKTRLMALFATGAAQQIAIEP